MTELSGITVNGSIIPEAEWKAKVMNLQGQVQAASQLNDEDGQIAILRKTLTAAVKQRVAGLPRFGVLLSGGVDSSLLASLCKQFGKGFTCYTVGMEDSPDILAAQQAAAALDVPLKQRIYEPEPMDALFREVVRILPKADVVSVGVGAVITAAADLAKTDGVSLLMSGLGSEEIFAGYERHAQAKDIDAECWAGLFNMHGRDFVRDAAIATHHRVRFLTPFLDPVVIAAAMRIPSKDKISGGEKKVILRKAAAAMGLPASIAFRKKQAAQYGSRFDAVLARCARQAGFAGKRPYVAALAGGA